MSEQPTEIQGTWKLSIVQGPDEGQEFILGILTRIGRGKGNDIPLTDGQSSRTHAIIERTATGADGEGFGYILNDRGSTNGTFLDGERISGPTRLQPGQVIRIGDTQLAVQSTSDPGAVPAGQAAPQTAPQAAPEPPVAEADRRTQPVQERQPAPPPASAPPASVPAAPAKPAPEKRRRWLVTCLVLVVLLGCVLTIAAAGIYYAATSGILNRRTVLNTFGAGYGEVSFINLTDSTLEADMNPLDAGEDSIQLDYDGRFAPFDIGGWGAIQPGRYQLEIRLDGPPESGTCTLQIGSGDSYQFVAVPEGLAITLKGATASSPDDLDMQTSSLCGL